MFSLPKLRTSAFRLLDKYGITLAGIFIFAYYLWATIDEFGKPHSSRNFADYFFQFDSLIYLWLLLYLGVKLHEYKRKHKEESERDKRIVLQFERQKMQLSVVDDLTRVMSDAINNPLAVISLSTGSIRQRFEGDAEIMSFLDRIDGALKRLREVLADFQTYQTKKIIQSSGNASSEVQDEPSDDRARRNLPPTTIPSTVSPL
jgi:signal transduction histidine kinase